MATNALDRTFKLLLSIIEDRYAEDGKINLCHRVEFNGRTSYTINLKTVQSVKEDISFLFQIFKGNSIPIEFFSDTIPEGIARCKKEIENDSFVEIIPVSRPKLGMAQYLAGIVGCIIITIAVLYFVVSILSYRGDFSPNMQAGLVFIALALAAVWWIILAISERKEPHEKQG